MRKRQLSKVMAVSALLVLISGAVTVPPSAAPLVPVATASGVPAIDAPTIKTNPNGDPYLIGAHIWPGWRQGTHSAQWRHLVHYPDREPLLGFYDEDRVEVWDWHIKFAKEHGLSYFNFLWDRGSLPGKPVTHPLRSHALEAFKQSALSDQMKYTINWNQLSPTAGVADFEGNIWPHFKVELTDPRYLVIDNRPVIYVNNHTAITDVANVIARLRELVGELANGNGGTFADAIVITSRTKESYSDYSYFYANSVLDCRGDFGSECDQMAEQIILDRFDGTRIPTLNMGWDKDPSTHKQFHGVPGKMFHQRVWRFTTPGYASMAQSVKNKMDAQTGLDNRLALAGAWDEWVEGHYIAPSRTYGYGYLEGIREAFTLVDNTPYHGDPLAEGFGPYDLNFTRDAAHYELDQTSGASATDSSGWGRHAELKGNPVWRPSGGHVGGALELDGVGDYIRLADADPGGGPGFMHDYVGLRTVSMWVKASTTSGTRVLYDQGGGSYGIGLRIKDGTLQGAIRKGPNTDLHSAPYPSDGAWHHVALAYQGRDEDGTADFYSRLYLDGVKVDEVRHTAEDGIWRMIRTHQDAAAVGARAGSDAFGDSPIGGYFQGLIDDVRIAPLELRPDEISGIAGRNVGIVDSKSGGIDYKAKGSTDSGLYYWTDSANQGDRGGSVKHTEIAGNHAVYTFKGSSIWYIARKGPFQGKAEVFVDGVSQGVFDLYSPEQQNQQVIFSKALPAGKHTIRIVATQTKNPDSKGVLVNVDYLKYAH